MAAGGRRREAGGGRQGSVGRGNTLVNLHHPGFSLTPRVQPAGCSALLQIPGTEQLAERVRKESSTQREKEVPCPCSRLWKVFTKAMFPEIV